jgi:hypothetical protein
MLGKCCGLRGRSAVSDIGQSTATIGSDAIPEIQKVKNAPKIPITSLK